MNGKKFVYKYHTRYESIPPEGMTMEELIRKNGIKSALEAASEIHINNLTYKVNYSVLTRKGNDNKYAYYKEEDTRLVYREDYEYNSGLYRNLKIIILIQLLFIMILILLFHQIFYL
jgi:hypothetical protein